MTQRRFHAPLGMAPGMRYCFADDNIPSEITVTTKASGLVPEFRHGRVYEGANLLQIGMPIGGIGAGCVCLSGYGALQDWSIRNRPATSAMADGHGVLEGAFAILHVKGASPITRLLEGPLPVERIYDQGLKAQGYRVAGYEGLPRMEGCAFQGEYPFGRVKLRDGKLPVEVTITGWNPMIPRDDRNSGIPCAILEYTLTNTSCDVAEFEFSFHLSHLAAGKETKAKGTRNHLLAGFGAMMDNTEAADAETLGSAALGVIGHTPKIKAMWFRGGWFDSISALWRQVSTGTFKENAGGMGGMEGHNGASVLVGGRLKPGESVTYPVVVAWYFPNVYQTYGAVKQEGCTPGSGCCEEKKGPSWRPYYAGQWKDAGDVAQYVRKQYESLRARTVAFHDALFSSTVPAEVIEAVSANLAILKSPTIIRQENGNVWAWEGCFSTSGCCHGTCTHVWNYAQALPHLYPQLERTLREQELGRSMDEKGHVNFRSALPDGATGHDYHPAADGQLGGIMKVYREWQISGDRGWMERMYPLAKRSLDYCIARWDPKGAGALFEPHHNTYDIEFWGPDGMCTSIYLGALAAGAAMARALGRDDDANAYETLAKKGAAYLDRELFNGEYYYQKVMWEGLADKSFAEKIAGVTEAGSEMDQLLKAEGPKYQYGTGCLSDGVIGAWMALMYGIESPQNRENVRKTLAAIHRHNYKRDLWEHASTQRPGYAMGHEAGLLLCTWPRGGKPTLPFVYSDEVWTGIEYQVAAHLVAEGMAEEGLEVVRGARSRYDGRVRNPFNEYECGSYYARSLASYSLLQAISGVRYSAVTRTLFVKPQTKGAMRVFFSGGSGWGTVTAGGDRVVIEMVEGELRVEEVVGSARRWRGDVVAKARAKCVIET